MKWFQGVAVLALALAGCDDDASERRDAEIDAVIEIDADVDADVDAETDADVDAETDAARDPDAAQDPDADPPDRRGACGALAVLEAPAATGENTWALVGQTGSQVEGGRCGGQGPEAVVPFVAPTAGWYTVTVRSDAFDPVLSLRDDCRRVESERACSDDRGATTAGWVVELAAGQLAWLLVDAFGPTGGPFELDVRRADAAEAPRVVSAQATVGPGGLNLAVRAEDTNADLVGLRVGSPGGADVFVEVRPGVFGQTAPTAIVRGLPPVEGAVRLAPVDSLGAVGAQVEVEVEAQVERALGEACGPQDITGHCGAGVCVEGVCVAASAPVLDGGAAWRSGDRLSFEVHGSDPSRDVTQAQVEVLDAAEQVLGEVVLAPSALAYEGDTFLFQAVANFLLPREAASIRVRLLDASERVSDPRTLALEPLGQLAPGSACDAQAIAGACILGTRCVASVCVHTAPEVVSARASLQAGQLVLVASGRDLEGDVVAARAQVGGVVVDLALVTPVLGEVDFTLRALSVDELPVVEGITLELIDSLGGTSAAKYLEITPLPAVAEGGVCDPDARFDRCAGALRCVPGNVHATCLQPIPVLRQATAYRGQGLISLQLVGIDADADTWLAHVQRLENPGDAERDEEIWEAAVLDSVGGQFTLLTLQDDILPEITHLRVRVEDALGHQSAPLEIEVLDRPQVALGAPCDPHNHLNACSTGRCVVLVWPDYVCADSAPQLVGGHAYRDGDTLALSLEGVDAELDVSYASFEVLGVDGVISQGDAFPIDGLFASPFVFRSRSDGALPAGAVGVRVWLVDWQDLQSAPLELLLEDLPVVGANAACDLSKVDNRCADGLRCEWTGDQPRCEVGGVPLLRGAAWRDDVWLSIVLRMPPGAFIAGVEGVLLANGVELADTAWQGDLRLEWTEEALVVRLRTHQPRLPEAMVVRVWVRDGFGDRGAPLDLPLAALPRLEAGAVCDQDAIEGRCGGDLQCVQQPDGTFACVSQEPRILDVQAVRAGPQLVARITFSALEEVVGADATRVTAAGLVAGSRRVLETEVLDWGGVWLATREDYLTPETTGVSLRLTDRMGRVSAPFVVDLVDQPVRALGEVCDPRGLEDRCGAGTCTQTPDGYACIDRRPVRVEATNWRFGDRMTAHIQATWPWGLVLHARVTPLGPDGPLVDQTRDLFPVELGGFGDAGPADVYFDAPDFLVPEAVAVRWVLVSGEEAGEPFDLPLFDLPTRALGEACDPNTVLHACVEGAACVDQGDGPRCIDRRPVLLVGEARQAGRDLVLVGEATEWLEAVEVAVLGAEGAVLGEAAAAIFGREIEATFAGLLPPDAQAVRVVMISRAGIASLPVVLPLVEMPRVAVGRRCDPQRLANRCVAGSVCVDGVCALRDTPRIVELTAWWQAEPEAIFGFELQALDADEDLSHVLVQFFDPAGGALGEVIGLGFSGMAYDEGAALIFARELLPLELPAGSEVELTLVDVYGLASAPVRQRLGRPAERPEGASCLVEDALTPCVEGTACMPDDRFWSVGFCLP
jgi:hypothetical protein